MKARIVEIGYVDNYHNNKSLIGSEITFDAIVKHTMFDYKRNHLCSVNGTEYIGYCVSKKLGKRVHFTSIKIHVL